MGPLGSLARAFVLDRLLRGQSRRARRGHHGYGGRRAAMDSPFYAEPYAGRRRGGLRFFGPIPYYSRRTRSGAQISVGGCCLPIPLAVLATTITAGVVSARRLARARRG